MTKTSKVKDRAHHGSKRGMKPRSKRNRVRPSRGGIGILPGMRKDKDSSTPDDNSSLVQIDVVPLKLPGDTRKTDRRIRVVRPYPFTFATFAKERWLGRSILDVYDTEFGSYPKCYYEAAIQEGRILVNGEKVDCEYKVKGNDELAHVVHRHEPAVAIASGPDCSPESPYIKVVYEDDNVIVVDKPSTLPIHPCGGYNLNSLFHILSEQNPSLKGSLYNVHRLDRLTSGLTIIAKSSKTATVLGKCIMNREKCHKIYVARVKGKFPLNAPTNIQLEHNGTDNDSTSLPSNGEWIVSNNANQDKPKAATCFWLTDCKGMVEKNKTLEDVFETRISVANLAENGQLPGALWLHLAVPVDIIDEKNGVCEAGNGKSAQTSFTVIGYDEKTDSTIVLAKPETGRTHQIRLHLQYLGHPIGNDPNYGGEMHFGDTLAKQMCEKARELIQTYNISSNDPTRSINSTTSDTPATASEIEKAGIGSQERKENETLIDFIKRTCVWCNRNKGEDRTLLEFLIRSQGIWLHALQYQMEGPEGMICYKTDFPEWSITTDM